MTISPQAWKRIAVGALAALVLMSFGWFAEQVIVPRVEAGMIAVQYLNGCVQAGICPTPQMIQDRINAQAKGAAGTVPQAKPEEKEAPATSAPTAPPKK